MRQSPLHRNYTFLFSQAHSKCFLFWGDECYSLEKSSFPLGQEEIVPASSNLSYPHTDWRKITKKKKKTPASVTFCREAEKVLNALQTVICSTFSEFYCLCESVRETESDTFKERGMQRK